MFHATNACAIVLCVPNNGADLGYPEHLDSNFVAQNINAQIFVTQNTFAHVLVTYDISEQVFETQNITVQIFVE